MGTLFAWDLRWPQQPIILSRGGIAAINNEVPLVSESEVWEVQYDRSTKSNMSSTRVLPAMICSEDGFLAVIEQGMYISCILLECQLIRNPNILPRYLFGVGVLILQRNCLKLKLGLMCHISGVYLHLHR